MILSRCPPDRGIDLPEARGVVVAGRARVAEGLQDGVGLEQVLLHLR
jgi:hypothetical protein